jgi:cyclophilin family peptidyl-prolyl cis-trans isomerase
VVVLVVLASLLLFAGGALGVYAVTKRLAGRSTESRAEARPTDRATAPAAAPDPGVSAGSASTSVSCDTARRPVAAAKPPVFHTPPPMSIDPARRYTATIDTTCGQIVIALDAKAAPQTVNNFVSLARAGFYDGLTWHRVVRGFVVQGGDPQGTGAGGPGYAFADELNPSGRYTIGTVAMANAGPDTNGSQFFVVVGTAAASLPPKYTIFGAVTQGIEVAQAFQRFAPEGEGPTAVPLYMFKVDIAESGP